MVRRIVKCSSCLKHFATTSGQFLCPSCRPTIVTAAAPDLPSSVQDNLIDSSHDGNRFSGNKRENNTSEIVHACNDVAAAGGKVTLSKKPKTCDEATKITTSSNASSKSIEGEDHDGDLCCISFGSKTDVNDEFAADRIVRHEVDSDRQIEADGSCCGSENDGLLHCCIEIDDDGGDGDIFHYEEEAPDDEEVNEPHEVDRKTNTENNDVCYICGANLSSKGLNSRVAHMKRCSTKHGQQTMTTRTDEMEELEPFASVSMAGVSNPYASSEWHGDVDRNQSVLKQFFKAPVRSLTNVLMAGSRHAFRRRVETTSVPNIAGKKMQKGSWASNSRGGGQCPSYKRIPGTDFICDGFYYACSSLTQNYFLTHFHSDHYGGITKKWNEGIIYCSLPTANLVNQNLGVEQKYLHPLPMNKPAIISSKGQAVKVTLLDANHCPGAVMFLFEVGYRRILHVGDFRWSHNIMLNIPQIRALSTLSPRLDELFLDTTYCDKKYQLPTQEEAVNAAIDVASEEMEKSTKRGSTTLFLFGSYTIGKEKIYLSVAKHLKKKVYVDSRRLRIIKALGWSEERMAIFTTNKEETCLWVVPLGKVNFKDMPLFLKQANKRNAGMALTASYDRVVGFRPTGWTFIAKDKKQTLLPCGQPKPGRHLISSKTNGNYTVHGVPYSEHSSFPELVDCVRCLQPRKIVPTVTPAKSEEQIELLLNAANEPANELD